MEDNNLYLVVVGDVDSGKSTLMGNILYMLGYVSEKEIHKYRKDADNANKGSFHLAWILDSEEEEREGGITSDICMKHISFEHQEKTFRITFFDTPGHADYFSSMISACFFAKISIFVVDASDKSYVTVDFQNFKIERLQNFLFVLKATGIEYIVFAINKMDIIEYNKDTYIQIRTTLHKIARQVGYKDDAIMFSAISGYNGDNILIRDTKRTHLSMQSSILSNERENGLLNTVCEAHEKPTESGLSNGQDLVCTVLNSIKDEKNNGCVSADLIIHSGSIHLEDRVTLLPENSPIIIKTIKKPFYENNFKEGKEGEYITVSARVMSGFDVGVNGRGMVLVGEKTHVIIKHTFLCKITIISKSTRFVPGVKLMFHYRNDVLPCIILELCEKVNPRNKNIVINTPRVISYGETSTVKLKLDREIAMGIRDRCKRLSRFILTCNNSAVSVGFVMESI